MKVHIPYPLPGVGGAVAVNSLTIGDGFLRVGGTPSVTQPDFWILAELDSNQDASIFNPIDGSYLTGVAGNMPVVPVESHVEICCG